MRALFLFLAMAMPAFATTGLRMSINLQTKAVTMTNVVAVRESVEVTLVSIGTSSPGDLTLRLTTLGTGTTQTLAQCASFVASGTNAVGTLDLNTEELVNAFSNKSAMTVLSFNAAVWDSVQSRLLGSAVFPIMNNPYAPGMPAPTPAASNIVYLTGASEFDGVVAGVSTQTAFTVSGSNVIIAIAQANGGAATNGINGVTLVEANANGFALSTNWLTLTLKTNYSAAAGTLSGAYSTSALLTLAVSGTNVVGGIDDAVSSVATGAVRRSGDTNMTGQFIVAGKTPALSITYTNNAWQLVRLGVGQEAQGGGAVFIFRSITNYVELYADTNSPAARGPLARKSSSSGFATIWDRHNDGTGSGLDADLIDGIDSTAFATGAPIYSLTGQNGSGLTNIQASAIAAGGVLPALDGSALTNLPSSGGAGSQTPWTNTVNAAGYGLTNAALVQWSAVTNYQWIRWVGTNPVEAILFNASGGVTGKVERYNGADFIFSYP